MSRLFFNNKKQNQSQLLRGFSHAFSKLHVFSRNFDWFIALPAPVVIGQSYYFGLGFSTVIKKRFIDDELKTAISLRAFIKGTRRRREDFLQLGVFEPFAVND